MDVFQWFTGGKQAPEKKRKRRRPAASSPKARPVLTEPDVVSAPAPVDEIVFGGSRSFGSELTFVIDSPMNRRCSSTGKGEYPGDESENKMIDNLLDETIDLEHILDSVQDFLDGSHQFKKGEDYRLNRYMEEAAIGESNSLDLETFMEQMADGKDVSKSAQSLVHSLNLKGAGTGISDEEKKSLCTILLDLDLDVDLISISNPVPQKIDITQQQRTEERKEAPKPENISSPLSSLFSREEQWPEEAPKPEELNLPIPLPKVQRPSAAPTPENGLSRERQRPRPFPIGLIVPVSVSSSSDQFHAVSLMDSYGDASMPGKQETLPQSDDVSTSSYPATAQALDCTDGTVNGNELEHAHDANLIQENISDLIKGTVQESEFKFNSTVERSEKSVVVWAKKSSHDADILSLDLIPPDSIPNHVGGSLQDHVSSIQESEKGGVVCVQRAVPDIDSHCSVGKSTQQHLPDHAKIPTSMPRNPATKAKAKTKTTPLISRFGRSQPSPEKHNNTKPLSMLNSTQWKTTATTTATATATIYPVTIKQDPSGSYAPAPEKRKQEAAKSTLDPSDSDSESDISCAVKKKQTIDETEQKALPEKKTVSKTLVDSYSMQKTTVSKNTNGAKICSRTSAPSSEIRKEKAIIVPSDLSNTYLDPDQDEKSKESQTFQVDDILRGVCCPNTMPQQASVTDVSNLESESHIPIPLPDLLCTNDDSRHLEPMAPSRHAPLVEELARGLDLGDPFPGKLWEAHESPDPTDQPLERTLKLPVLMQLETTNPPLGESKQSSDRVSSEHVTEVCPDGNSHHLPVQSQHGSILEGARIVSSRDGDFMYDVSHDTKRHNEPLLSEPDDHSQTKPMVQLADAIPDKKQDAQSREETLSSPATDRNQEGLGIAAVDELIKTREKRAARILRALDEDFAPERLLSNPQVQVEKVNAKAPDDSNNRLSIQTTRDDNNGNIFQDITSEEDTAGDNEEIEIVFVALSFQENEIFSKDGTHGTIFDSLREKVDPVETSILWWKQEDWADQIKYKGPVYDSSTLEDMIEIITCTDSSDNSLSTAQPCENSSLGRRGSHQDAMEVLTAEGGRVEGNHNTVGAGSVASTIQQVASRSTAHSSIGRRASLPDVVEILPGLGRRAEGINDWVVAGSVASTIQEVDSRSTVQRFEIPSVGRRAEGTHRSRVVNSDASTIQAVDSRSTAQRYDDLSIGRRESLPDVVELLLGMGRRAEDTQRSRVARSVASTIQEVDSRSTAQRCDDSSHGSRKSLPDTVEVRPDVERREEETHRSIAARSVASTIQEPSSCPSGNKPADDKSKNEQFRERGHNKSLSLLRESVTSAQNNLGQRLSALIPKGGLDSTQLEHDILSKTQFMSDNSNVLMFQPTINVYQGSNFLEAKDSAQTTDVEKTNSSVDQRPETECDASNNPSRGVETSHADGAVRRPVTTTPPSEGRTSKWHTHTTVSHGIDDNSRQAVASIDKSVKHRPEQEQTYTTGIWQMTMNNRASDGLESGIKEGSTVACGQPQSAKEPREGLPTHHKFDSASTQRRSEYDKVGVSTSICKAVGAIDMLGVVDEAVASYDESVKQISKHGHTDSIRSTPIKGGEQRPQKQGDEPSTASAWRMTMSYLDTTSRQPLYIKEPHEGSNALHKTAYDPVVSGEDFTSIGKSASPDESHGDFDQPATLYSDPYGRVTYSLDAPTEASSEVWESIYEEESHQEPQSPYSDSCQTFHGVEGEGRQVGGAGFLSELWRSMSPVEKHDSNSALSTLQPRGGSYERSPRGQLEVILEKDLGKASTEETEPEVAVIHHGTEEVVELVYQEDLALCGSIDEEEVEIVFVEKSFMKRDGFSFGEAKGIVFNWLESETTKQSRDKESGKGERRKKLDIISLVDLDRSKDRYLSSYQNEDFGSLPAVSISRKAASSYRNDIRRWLRDTKFDAPVDDDSDLNLPTLRGQIALPIGNGEREVPLHDEYETRVHNATDATIQIPIGQRDMYPVVRKTPVHEHPVSKRFPDYAQDDIAVASVPSLCRDDECEILFTMDPHQDKVIQERREGPVAGNTNNSGQGIGRADRLLETQRIFSKDPPGSLPRDPYSNSESLKWNGPECQLKQVEQVSTRRRYGSSRNSESMATDSRDETNDSRKDGDMESPLYSHRSQLGQPLVGDELTWKQVELSCRPPGLWRPDQARRDEISSVDRRQPHAPPPTHPSRLDFQRRVGSSLKSARESKYKGSHTWESFEVVADRRALHRDESSLLSSSISENIESNLSKRARSNFPFSGNRMGNHDNSQADFQSYIEDESTGSSLTDFAESRGTQSTRDDFEAHENERESSSDGHVISPTESIEIVFFDEMETDALESSLFGSKSSTYSSHAEEETHFPITLSLDLRTKTTPKLSLELRSKTTPSPLPPQLSLDLRSKHLREGLVPIPSCKAILKNQKGRMGEPPSIDRSSSSLRSGVELSDVGDGKRQRLLHARRRMLSRHGASKSANGQEKQTPRHRNAAARSVKSEGRDKRNEESRSPELISQIYYGPAS